MTLPKTVGGGICENGNSVSVTAVPDSGYKFIGWYDGDNLVSTDIKYEFIPEKSINLAAKFEKNVSSHKGGASLSGGTPKYTVRFETNGGNEIENINVKQGQTIGSIEIPKKDGYVFTGWYSDKELTKAYNKDDKVTASETLYAGWKIDPIRQVTLTIGKKDAVVFGETKINDVVPKIVNDRTMLPIRFIAEALGAAVEWIASEKKVIIVKDDIKINIYIGSDNAQVNDKSVELDSPAFIENDRTYLPLRFVSENLGASVEWNEETETVTITK